MRFAALTAAALALVACNKKDASTTRSDAVALTGSVEQSAAAPPIQATGRIAGIADMAAPAPPPPQAPRPDRRNSAVVKEPNAVQVGPSMLIRTGGASIEVRELDPAIMMVRQLATQLGGYVANSSITGGRDQIRSATLELKIPAARYDQAVGGLGAIGKVESVNTNVEDVGEEYVDIDARVANAKRLEERLVNLLATRTGKLEDVLAVERELARVREEIERYDGRLRYLRTRAAVSTLTITVHEPAPILGQNPGDNPIVGALKQAWRNFVGFVAWCIASLGVLVPLGAIAVGGWIAYRRLRRRT
ncbi:MAG TPA: DUF4349 domain-containing protein [Gemmatimonadaceae bacterium]